MVAVVVSGSKREEVWRRRRAVLPDEAGPRRRSFRVGRSCGVGPISLESGGLTEDIGGERACGVKWLGRG